MVAADGFLFFERVSLYQRLKAISPNGTENPSISCFGIGHQENSSWAIHRNVFACCHFISVTFFFDDDDDDDDEDDDDDDDDDGDDA